jgi:hypothetical protein
MLISASRWTATVTRLMADARRFWTEINSCS